MPKAWLPPKNKMVEEGEDIKFRKKKKKKKQDKKGKVRAERRARRY